MPEIDSKSLVAIVLSISVATIIALLLYRRTAPRLPANYRIGLGCLRWLAVLMLMLLVTSPKVSIVKSHSRRPAVAVLIDVSRSMQYPDSSKVRILSSHGLDAALRDLSSRLDVRFYTFADDLAEISLDEVSSLEPLGSRTDLARAIKNVLAASKLKPSAFVVISDGSNNYGDDPIYYASHLSVPFYCVPTVGIATPDIALERVEADEVAYAGSRITVWLDITGTLDRTVGTKVTISDSTGILYTGDVVVPSHGARTRLPIKVNAGEVGIHRFRVKLDPFEGEKVTINNEAAFSLRVIKGKIKVCLVAPYPSWDFAFAHRALKEVPGMDVTTYFGKSQPFSLDDAIERLEDALTRVDVLVIFRGASLEYEAVEQYLSRGGSLLFVSGKPNQRLFADFGPFIAATERGSGTTYGTPVPTEQGMSHDVLRVGMETQDFSWSRLPPLPIPRFVAGARKGAVVLLEGKTDGNRIPMLALIRRGAGRVAAFSCFDVWKWDLSPKGFGLNVNAYDELLTNLVTWLTETEEIKPLTASASKLVYMQGEPIDISARLVDEDLKPVAAARVNVVIRDISTGQAVWTSDMTDEGNGNYSVRVDQLGPGTYSAVVRAYLPSGQEIAQLIQFDVDERGLEDSNFNGDLAMLEQLAASTGGIVLNPGEIEDVASAINPGTIVIKSTKAFALKLNLPTFALLVVLFGVEWLIRKRKLLV